MIPASLLWRIALPVLVAAFILCMRQQPVSATPVFAQAYGVKCEVCHTQMPFLNSFGRYIQRTGYNALSPQALKHAFPVFLLDPRLGYAFQPYTTTHTFTSLGNTTDAYGVGALGPDFNWHIEQWISFEGHWGFLDTTWLSYSGIAKHTGHLFVGKLPAINEDENEGPLVMRDINDASTAPPVLEGLHDYAIDETGSRWGVKYNQFFGRFVTEVQWVGNSSALTSFNNAYNYAPANGSDRSFQYRAAYADPAHPWEIGVFGEAGTYGWYGYPFATTQHYDNYALTGPYIMKDPREGSPGFRLQWATTSDSSPGFLEPSTGVKVPVLAGQTNGSYMTGSIFQLFVHNRLMANLTYLHTNMPLVPIGAPGAPIIGLVQQTGPQTAGTAGLSYEITPFVRIFAAETSTTYQKPYWQALFWVTPPLRDRR